MSNRTQIDADLQRYLNELLDKVDYYVRQQENDPHQDIRNTRLIPNNLYQPAAKMFEHQYFELKKNVTEALEDAADIVVNASIFATMKNNNTDRYLPDDLYNDFREDHDFTQSVIGRGRGNDSYDSRQDRTRRSSRTDNGASRTSRTDRNDRNERTDYGAARSQRDEVDRNSNRNEEQRKADERAEQRKNRDNNQEQVRDNTVAQAKINLEANTKQPVDDFYIKLNPQLFVSEGKTLPISPIYFLGNQKLFIKDGKLIIDQIEQFDMADFEYEKHRTDLYLRSRASIAPSASIREQALDDAITARRQYGDDVIEQLMVRENVVKATKPVDIDQYAASQKVIGTYYGQGTPLTIINGVLNQLKLNHLPKHPVAVSVMRYPLWTLSKRQATSFEALLSSPNLRDMMANLVKLQTELDDQQWTYVHDRITHMFNEILKIELEVRPYLDSIVRDWADFVQWLEKYNSGALVGWFNNNISNELGRTFKLTDTTSEHPHSFLNKDEEGTKAVGYVARLIYVPVSSDNFTVASTGKLGRVLESVTGSLYTLLSQSMADEASEHLLVTSSDDSVKVYQRLSTVTSKIIFIGDVNW